MSGRSDWAGGHGDVAHGSANAGASRGVDISGGVDLDTVTLAEASAARAPSTAEDFMQSVAGVRLGVVGLGYVGLPLAGGVGKHLDKVGFGIHHRRTPH